MTSSKEKPLQGLVAAPFTPFHSDLSLNLGVIDEFSAYLATAGVTGVFVCGTTGEFASLTLTEREKVAEAWSLAGKRQGLKVIVHVGDNSLANAQALAQHAAGLEIDGISMVPPSYFKPDDVGTVMECLRGVAEVAPKCPLYYYHIPGLTGVEISTSELIRLVSSRIPSFAGVKFSSIDLVELQRCRALDDGSLNLLFGCDEMLLAALSLGVDGAVGSTYNYAASLYTKVIAAFQSGRIEEARQYQRQSVALVSLLSQVSPLGAGKSLLKRVGFDFGPVRLPLRSLSSDQQSAFDRAIDELEIF